MEATSFAKIVEQHVRRALKAEDGHGESQRRAWTGLLYLTFVRLSHRQWQDLFFSSGYRFRANMIEMNRLSHIKVECGDESVLSMQAAYTPIKLITALQMIKPEGHTLRVNYLGVLVCMVYSPNYFPCSSMPKRGRSLQSLFHLICPA